MAGRRARQLGTGGNTMQATYFSRLLQFLRDDLQVGSADLALALKHPEHQSNLPIILWQYGAISAEQLERIFDWLERTPPEAR